MLFTSPIQQPLGLNVNGTNFIRNGSVFRGIGVNHFSMLLRQIVVVGPAVNYDEDMRAIKQDWGLPFVRFAAGWWDRTYWYANWYQNKAAYFAAFDAVVESAENRGIGLIPTLFWNLKQFTDATYDVYGSRSAPSTLATKSSNAWLLAAEFIDDVVSRYRTSPAIWACDLANEACGSCGPEYYSTWALDGTKAAWLNWGTRPEGGTYAASDKMSMVQWRDFTRNAVELVHSLDGRGRFVSSGSGLGTSFAVGVQTADTLTADTYAQRNSFAPGGQSFFSYEEQAFTAMCNHIYPQSLSDLVWFNSAEKTAAELIAYYKAWSNSAGKPFYLGEWGATYHGSGSDPISVDQATEEATFSAVLASIVANDVQLSSCWNYGGDLAGANEWEWWKLTDPARLYQLTAIADANRTMAALS